MIVKEIAKRTIAELVADTACEYECDSARAIEIIAERSSESLYEDRNIDMTEKQWIAFETTIEKFLGENAQEEADEILDERAEFTRESIEAMQEARYA